MPSLAQSFRPEPGHYRYVPRTGDGAPGGDAPVPIGFGPLDESADTLGSWSRDLLEIQSDVIAAAGDLQKVMQVVVAGALRAVPSAAGAVVEIRDGDCLVYRAASGAASDNVGLRLPSPVSLSWLCILTGKPQVSIDTEGDLRVDTEACQRIGARSMIVVPLSLQGNPVGVLKVFAATPAAFDNRDLLTVQLLAGPIAIGLANAAQADTAKRFTATFAQAAVGIAHVAPAGHDTIIKVIAPGDDYWPLPWYLRRFGHIGWYESLPSDPYAPIMMVSSKLDARLDEKSDRKWIMAGLSEMRPKVYFELYVELELWKKYVETLPREVE